MAAEAETRRGRTKNLLRLLPDGGWRLVAALVALVAVQSVHPLAVIATTGLLVGRSHCH